MLLPLALRTVALLALLLKALLAVATVLLLLIVLATILILILAALSLLLTLALLTLALLLLWTVALLTVSTLLLLRTFSSLLAFLTVALLWALSLLLLLLLLLTVVVGPLAAFAVIILKVAAFAILIVVEFATLTLLSALRCAFSALCSSDCFTGCLRRHFAAAFGCCGLRVRRCLHPAFFLIAGKLRPLGAVLRALVCYLGIRCCSCSSVFILCRSATLFLRLFAFCAAFLCGQGLTCIRVARFYLLLCRATALFLRRFAVGSSISFAAVAGTFRGYEGLLVYDFINEALLVKAGSVGNPEAGGYVLKFRQQQVIELINVVRHE